MAVRGVIFDVGGVLVESPFVAALRWRDELDIPNEVMGIMFAEYAAVPEPGSPTPLWHQVEMGLLELDTFVSAVREQFADHLEPDHPAMHLRGGDFNVFKDAGAHWPMVHRARQLRAEGIVTAILTNNVKEWGAWRDVIPLDEFDVVIDSCEVGLRKPDPAIWHVVLGAMGIDAAEAVFLDDHPGNVEAARRLDIRSVVVGSDIDAALAELEAVLTS
jgi:epoxide hydrolase-like predicted phosphatase